jgi:outer membrane protein OmpA-like peptidoglycan-associated protein
MLGTHQTSISNVAWPEYVFCATASCSSPTRKTPVAALDKRSASGLRVAASAIEVPTRGHAEPKLKPLQLTVYFDLGSARLAEVDVELVRSRVSEIRGHDVVVRGYTDALGGSLVNERLSRERALTIADLLKKEGIQEQRITMSAHPKCCGLQSGLSRDEAVSPSERRAEILVLNHSLEEGHAK